jgi:hypothetical protein
MTCVQGNKIMYDNDNNVMWIKGAEAMKKALLEALVTHVALLDSGMPAEMILINVPRHLETITPQMVIDNE